MKKTLDKPINFEDTFYILHTRIRFLQDVLALDVSPDLFLDKAIDDMEFIDKTLAVLIQELTQNDTIEERDDVLDNHSETEWQFSQVLVRFISSTGTISASNFPVLRDKVQTLRDQSAARRKTADDAKSKKEGAETPLVSTDEMNELLKVF
jgi:hypothetical protein